MTAMQKVQVERWHRVRRTEETACTVGYWLVTASTVYICGHVFWWVWR